MLIYHARKGTTWDGFSMGEHLPRNDPDLVHVIDALGTDATAGGLRFFIAELPVGTRYIIDELNGGEVVRAYEDFDWKTA